MRLTGDSGFDVAVVDKDDHGIALVQVKAYPVQRWDRILPGLLSKVGESVDFVLAIDPGSIHLFHPSGGELGGPIAILSTRSVLEYYDAEFPTKTIFGPYLETLVEAWLRDLAYHWKSEHPPGSDELRRAGFLEKLEGATTYSIDD